MQIKEMILMELLLDKLTTRFTPDKVYQIVFKLDDGLYTGSFLQEEIKDKRKQKYVISFDKLALNPLEPNDRLYESTLIDGSNGESRLFKKFLAFLDFEDTARITHLKSLVETKHILLQKIKQFISESNPDDFLNNQIDFGNTIYNLERLDKKFSLEFYVTDEQENNIIPVSLKENAWVI